MLKQTLVALALLAPVSSFAQAPPPPCTTEQECLTHVLAEKLAQTVIQAAQMEAKLRVTPPVANIPAGSTINIPAGPTSVSPSGDTTILPHPEHPGEPMTPRNDQK